MPYERRSVRALSVSASTGVRTEVREYETTGEGMHRTVAAGPLVDVSMAGRARAFGSGVEVEAGTTRPVRTAFGQGCGMG